MQKKYLIVAPNTGVGKTYITCLLTKSLLKENKKVLSLKPIITGFDRLQENDVSLILKAQNLEYNNENIEKISPFRYKLPLAVNMAAKAEGKIIDPQEVIKFINQSREEYEYILIETAGGIMSPLAYRYNNLDLIKDLNLEVILVVGNYLGSISDALSALKLLEISNIKIVEIILNEMEENLISLDVIKAIIREYTKVPVKVVMHGKNYCINSKKPELTHLRPPDANGLFV